eukprot:jgi/Picre1/32429/NNA_007775.t1
MDYRTALSILGISDTATASVSKIRKAYLRRALELHPDRQRTDQDKQRANEAFVRLREAYEMVLLDQYPESTKEDVDLTRASFPQGIPGQSGQMTCLALTSLCILTHMLRWMMSKEPGQNPCYVNGWRRKPPRVSSSDDEESSSSASVSSSLG